MCVQSWCVRARVRACVLQIDRWMISVSSAPWDRLHNQGDKGAEEETKREREKDRVRVRVRERERERERERGMREAEKCRIVKFPEG